MKNIFKYLLFAALSLVISCNDSDGIETEATDIVAPATYAFSRNGVSTVSFSGQTTRIAMAEEFVSALIEDTTILEELQGMFAHVEGENDFLDTDLNASDKSIRSKVAASFDYFYANATDATAIKEEFDSWTAQQVSEVLPYVNTKAEAGTAGYVTAFATNGGSTRYVNSQGVELNQLIAKGLIGGLIVDQMLNNYLSVNVLDAVDNVSENDANTLAESKNYTTMEHKWDEAYGYLYGAEVDPASPVLLADSFLNKYLSRVDGDTDFVGIAEEIYNAFKLGRAAIVAKNYDVRDAQAAIIREKVSEIIGIRSVYYLQAGKKALEADTVDYAVAFHDLSEGLGFVYSLQFTRKTGSTAPYFTKTEVDKYLSDLMLDGNGLWEDDITTKLQVISEGIASKFAFTLEEASN